MNVVPLTAALGLAAVFSAFGQEPVASPPTPLSQLLAEAGETNPHISAADHGAPAARQMAPQVTTRPEVHLPAVECGQPEAICGIYQQRLCLHRRRSFSGIALSREVTGARRSR